MQKHLYNNLAGDSTGQLPTATTVQKTPWEW